MTMPWFRMYHEIVDDAKLKLLPAAYRWHYVGILCCKAQGLLDGQDTKLARRMVAVKLGIELDELDKVAAALGELGLTVTETLQPVSWNKRQMRSDTSTERVRKHREKQKPKEKKQQKQTRNAMKRYSNGLDKDIDKDIDKEKNKNPMSNSKAELDAEAVFNHWQHVMQHPKAKLDSKRKRKIKDRLKDGYTLEDLFTAIRGCAKSPHHMGQNDKGAVYDDIELICRDAPHVDKFIRMADGPDLTQMGSAARQTANAALEWVNMEVQQ